LSEFTFLVRTTPVGRFFGPAPKPIFKRRPSFFIKKRELKISAAFWISELDYAKNT
jgi:hypothetical protein